MVRGWLSMDRVMALPKRYSYSVRGNVVTPLKKVGYLIKLSKTLSEGR